MTKQTHDMCINTYGMGREGEAERERARARERQMQIGRKVTRRVPWGQLCIHLSPYAACCLCIYDDASRHM